jgi:hypothetical protein
MERAIYCRYFSVARHARRILRDRDLLIARGPPGPEHTATGIRSRSDLRDGTSNRLQGDAFI